MSVVKGSKNRMHTVFKKNEKRPTLKSLKLRKSTLDAKRTPSQDWKKLIIIINTI